MPTLLTRTVLATLQEAPLEVQEVSAQELGADLMIYVRMMTAAACERYYRRSARINEQAEGHLQLDLLPSARLMLVLETVCDQAGELLFALEDIPWLEQQPAALINRWFWAAFRLNRLDESFTELEEARKNSATSQRNDSGIAWPSNGVALSAAVKLNSPVANSITG